MAQLKNLIVNGASRFLTPIKGDLSGTSDYSLKMKTYKQESSTETYGTAYPLWAQWETNTVLKLLCTGYSTKVDIANSAGDADTVDGHHFHWSGQSGQPTWVWGGNDSANMYVYNPLNFSVEKSRIVQGNYTTNGGQQNPNYFGKNNVGFLMMNTTVNGNSQYKDWIIMDCYSGTDVGGGVALGVNRQSLGAYIMRSSAERTSWTESAELLHTANYSSILDGRYVNTSGDTMSGGLKVNDYIFGYRYTKTNNAPAFIFDKPGSHYTGIGANGENDTISFGPVSSDGNFTWVSGYNQIWKFQGNLVTTGTLSLGGALNLANGTWNKAGDDAYFGDNNTAGSFAIKGINGTTNLKMVTYGADSYGTMSWNGSNFVFSHTISGNLSGNATTASYPQGFASRTEGATWGNTTGTSITSWNDSTGGSIDFRRDNPSSGKISMKVDGRVYVNEGSNPVMGMASANGYWGIGTPDGNTTDWIRTTVNGIIPYQSGGHGNLGTSTWPFNNIYGNTIYEGGSTLSNKYLAKSGGTMTGQLYTSFRSAVAMGSYQAAATTLPNLVAEVRYSSGCMGSVSFSSSYTADNGLIIPSGWYNFIYSPHRSGGVNGSASGDNHNYGNLLLFGMTVDARAYRIRVAGGSIAEISIILTGNTIQTNSTYTDSITDEVGLHYKIAGFAPNSNWIMTGIRSATNYNGDYRGYLNLFSQSYDGNSVNGSANLTFIGECGQLEANYLTLGKSSGQLILNTAAETKRVAPMTTNTYNLGLSDYRWLNIYTKNAVNVSSDLNVKKNLRIIDGVYIELFDLIEPYRYNFTYEGSDRIHTGFIAQYVENAMEQVGLTAEDLAFFCKDKMTEKIKIKTDKASKRDIYEEVDVLDENGNPKYFYSLRYEEYIAIMAAKIKHMEKEYERQLHELEEKMLRIIEDRLN